MRVIGYRAPSWSITAESLWALDVLAEEGFVYDASIFPIRHDLYGYAGGQPLPAPRGDGERSRVDGVSIGDDPALRLESSPPAAAGICGSCRFRSRSGRCGASNRKTDEPSSSISILGSWTPISRASPAP